MEENISIVHQVGFNVSQNLQMIIRASALVLFSSVWSSNSHLDLQLTQQTHRQLFQNTPVLINNFHFLSNYSYIKGNHWTNLLATCIPYG